MNRAELFQMKKGISLSKIESVTEKIYRTMCEEEITLIEARKILAELGCIINEAEKRSPNTLLSEIPKPYQIERRSRESKEQQEVQGGGRIENGRIIQDSR